MSGRPGSAMLSTELWLIGTTAEVAALVEVIRQTARVLYLSTPDRLTGADTGRIRRYLRLAVATQPSDNPNVNPPSATGPAEPMASLLPQPRQPQFP